LVEDNMSEPFVFIHDPAREQRDGLSLAGTLVTPYPKQADGSIMLTEAEDTMIAELRARLVTDRRAGLLPEGDVTWLWPGAPGWVPSEHQTEAWVRGQIAKCATLAFSIPK
jgi:hypothetical protein